MLKSNRVERKLSRIPVFNTLWLLKYKMILKRHNIQVVIDVDVHNSLITTKVVSKDKVRIVSWDHLIMKDSCLGRQENSCMIVLLIKLTNWLF